MKKILLQTTIFILLLTPAFAFSGFQQDVLIYPQPDSPLQISNVVSKWRISTDDKGQEWNMLAVEFVVHNTGNKTIRAYTIRQFEGDFNKDKGATLIACGLFNLNQSQDASIGETGYRKIPKSITLAVDYVEFTDGTTWGQDISESAQRLIGLRAATEASVEYLKKINKQNGIEVVIKALDEMKDHLLPENQSASWKIGFNSGIKTTKIRIKRAYEEGEIKAAETELQKPFDTSSRGRIK